MSGMIYQANEDFNFLQGAEPTFTDSFAGSFRGAMNVRGVVQPAPYGTSLNPAKSDQLAAVLTSGWFSWQEALGGKNEWNSSQPPNIGGLGQFSSVKGLFLGATSANAQKLALFTYDGTTYIQLAAEAGASLSTSSLQRFDVHFVYSSTGSVNVYLAGVLVLTFNGDITISGVAGFDCYINGPMASNMGYGQGFSEVMVATDDTRPRLALVTQAANAQGTTNDWTNNTYTNTNELAYSDANPTYDDTNGDDQQYGLTPTPSGTWNIDAVAIAVRGAVGSGSSVSKMALGYNQAGTVYFGSGAVKTPAAFYSMLYQLDLVNPNGSTAWTQAVVNAQQVNLEAQT